jgi:fumarate reductase (CoM/CoB) subunit A
MTGDGQAILFRHGAELVNLEFHQLGPALVHPYVQLFSGSCFRLYPKLLNAAGEEFLPNYLPPGVHIKEVYDEKSFPFTSTNVSRYIDISMAHEVSAGRGTARGAVYFSFAHVPPQELEAGLPNTVRWLRERGVDPQREKLEVGVAFQCMNGGVRMTGADAQSTIPGLFVIGELAGGIRGPDRPGGNSLAEGQVFGHRAGTAAAQRSRGLKRGEAHTLAGSLEFLRGVMTRGSPGAPFPEMAAAVRRAMQRNCLVEKTAEGLNAALATVIEVKSELERNLALTPETLVDGLSVRNLAQASELVLRACLNRKETRSAHYRLDYPKRDDAAYLHSYVMRRDGDGIVMNTLEY